MNDNVHEQTMDILKGKAPFPSIFHELKRTLEDKIEIRIANIAHDRIVVAGAERSRIRLLVAHETDFEKLHESPFVKNKSLEKRIDGIVEAFLAGSGSSIEGFHRDDYFVVYEDFTRDYKTVLNTRYGSGIIEMIEPRYRDYSLWRISGIFSGVVVFYHYDKDIETNERLGISRRIKEEYFECLKKHDELDRLNLDSFYCKFDSKQNLDENFEGNLFYYFR